MLGRSRADVLAVGRPFRRGLARTSLPRHYLRLSRLPTLRLPLIPLHPFAVLHNAHDVHHGPTREAHQRRRRRVRAQVGAHVVGGHHFVRRVLRTSLLLVQSSHLGSLLRESATWTRAPEQRFRAKGGRVIPPRGSSFARTALAGLNRSGPSPVCVNARKSLPFSVLQQFTHIHPVVVRRSSGAWLPNGCARTVRGARPRLYRRRSSRDAHPPMAKLVVILCTI